MDPITAYRLGQIVQQEILEECLGEQYLESVEPKRGVTALWQRLRTRLSADQAQPKEVLPLKQQSQKAIA